MAHDPQIITNVPYDFNLANHEAVALLLAEQHQTKSTLYYEMVWRKNYLAADAI